MKRYRVRLTVDAEQDLIDIYHDIALRDCVQHADHVLDKLEQLSLKLAELPERGHLPPELERIGISHYRQVVFKPYRVIYQIAGQQVFVHCILDGRRDMPSLLERRLIR